MSVSLSLSLSLERGTNAQGNKWGGWWWWNLHQRPAEYRYQDHGQPAGHLGGSGHEVGSGEAQAVPCEESGEGVPDAGVRLDRLQALLGGHLGDVGGGHVGVVEAHVADDGVGGPREGNVVQGRWVGAPGLAEEVVLFAVDRG
jgi:hypothetical protein